MRQLLGQKYLLWYKNASMGLQSLRKIWAARSHPRRLLLFQFGGAGWQTEGRHLERECSPMKWKRSNETVALLGSQ